MVTVVDPTGTPSAIFNRSGVSIVEVAATGSPTRDVIPTPMSGITVVLVSSPSPDAQAIIELPSTSEIGDTIEVYRKSGEENIDVAPAPGDAILPPTSPPSFPRLSGARSAVRFRKVDAANWVCMLAQG